MRVTMRAALTVLLGRATVAAAQDVAVQISDENEGHLRCEECQAIVQVATKMIGRSSAYNKNKGRANPGEIGRHELIGIFANEVCNQTEYDVYGYKLNEETGRVVFTGPGLFGTPNKQNRVEDMHSLHEAEWIELGHRSEAIAATCKEMMGVGGDPPTGQGGPLQPFQLYMVYRVATTSAGSKGPRGRLDALRVQMCESKKKGADACYGLDDYNMPVDVHIGGKDTKKFLDTRKELDIHNEMRAIFEKHSQTTFRGLDERGRYQKIGDITKEWTDEHGADLESQGKMLKFYKDKFNVKKPSGRIRGKVDL